MKRAEAEKLLGGYATGTLTEAERRVLFEAALADQKLFDALADEEALRELLADARVRRRLLEALAEPEAGLWERLLGWWRRPWAWGVAGTVAVAALVVVLLLPVYRTTKRPAVLEVAQKLEPPAAPVSPPSAPQVAAAPRQRARAPARSEAEPQPSQPAPAEPRPVERAEEKQVLAEAEARPRLEAAPAGVVGGVAGEIVAAVPPAASQEADARRLYNAPAAEWKEAGRSVLRARQAADVAGAPPGPVGIRYAILKLGPGGQYSEAAPGAVFARGDVIRLSVEANRNGVIRVMRQDATGVWIPVGQVTAEARAPQVIPAEGLRLEKPERLAVEFVRGGAAPAPAGKPRLQKAADEHAVYVVDASGASQVRAEIEISVR